MTWSLLARDPATGELGVAVATRFFAVGALCPKVEGGVAAVATQALLNPMLARRAMDALRAGAAEPEALVAALLEADAGRDHRQFHLLAANGRSARFTGAACVGWRGHLEGPDCSLAGNMLAGEAVLSATRDAFLAARGPLADRMLAAMEAGEAAGGDKRGRQSAALVLASRDPYPDLDIRADDHADPLAELRRLLAVARERFVHFRALLAGEDHPGVFDRAVIEAVIAERTKAAR